MLWTTAVFASENEAEIWRSRDISDHRRVGLCRMRILKGRSTVNYQLTFAAQKGLSQFVILYYTLL
jgi:hypothetical protein